MFLGSIKFENEEISAIGVKTRLLQCVAQSAGAVEYTDCISSEE